ncbi:hypothetical protein ACQEVF_59080 [Nonomuraea polychroma]|uniref:hypothetical protein n=1 Tax=Nonomuraea polychroma TaxID=46176 RepID=UPI003D917405
MISREQAAAARDHAHNALRSHIEHKRTCRVCSTEGVPCQLGSIIERGTAKFVREATNALDAYLPTGTQVTYHGDILKHRGRTFLIIGPSPRFPWAGYTIGHEALTFEAPLGALRLVTGEAKARDMLASAKHVVKVLAAILARYGVALDVSADVTVSGRVLVGWSPVDLNAAERSAMHHDEQEARQYIGAALYLLQLLRSACAKEKHEDMPLIADRARKLAARVGVRV